MKITKHYSKNLNLGNYESARIGITLEKEVKKPTKQKLIKISKQLLKMCKKLVDKELAELKEEKEVE
jgi:hypothetical protein